MNKSQKMKLSEQRKFWKNCLDSHESQQLKAAGFNNTEELLSLPVVCLDNLKALGDEYTADIVAALYYFYYSDEDETYKHMLIVKDYCDGTDFDLSLLISIDELLYRMKRSNPEAIARITIREILNVGYLGYNDIKILVSEILGSYKKVFEYPVDKFENKYDIQISGNKMFRHKKLQEGEYQ